ncbi:ORF6N domain-containing protein [Algoriphagus sp.]|uniref:ORF6N domain-containing protein n=1 Tax=Algoriphagus sp. TaxID=1872435 RepID=UPI003F70A916
MELTISDIENRIFTIRGNQVMVDRDLSDLYQVDTKVLNQAVKRNSNRFPAPFRFQLTKEEKMELVTNCDRLESLKHSSSNPYVFTEQGVAMLSAVLRSEVAVNVSIQIMQAFVAMRKFLLNHVSVFQRLDQVELKQLKTDEKIEQIFKALESGKPEPKQGVFFDGQVFDAYAFASDIIKKAKKNIILIDNYIDESTITHLSKKADPVKVHLFTKIISKQLALDIKKANEQYASTYEIHEFKISHDRFLIIDQKELYHIGASLKDLGKKWFAFSKMDSLTETILTQLKPIA